MGSFCVTEHFILLDVVIGFSVAPAALEYICISPMENDLSAPAMRVGRLDSILHECNYRHKSHGVVIAVRPIC